jgi:polyferredoxin
MCWADRTTLILGFLWGSCLLLLLGPQNPYAFSTAWLEGFAFLFFLPTIALWIVLRLILGNRGALAR